MKKYILISVILFAPFASQASCDATGCSSEKLLQVYTNATGDIYVKSEGDTSRVNCTRLSNVFFTLKKTAPNFKEIYANLLLSRATNQSISLRTRDGSPDCEILYVTY